MKYALFLGCTVPVRAQNYELAVRKVANILGIELVDIKDFACCGFPIKSIDTETSLLIGARNLCIASENNLDICTVCSACTSTLTELNYKLITDTKFRHLVNTRLSKLGKSYTNEIKVRHFVRVLYEEIGLEGIKEKVSKELTSLRVGAHYGCHYLKPSEIYEGFDNPEFPNSIDKLIEVTGANFVDYNEKRLCCGGAILGVDERISLTMANRKLASVSAAECDALISICPFCSVMYEDNQRKIEATFNVSYNLPVIYYPQLLGLALGIDQKELGFRMNKVGVNELLSKLG
ncbi:MAG TPA: CoB--CoM heterodisulfide reductase subunit B [bacterium (Candidatus Stahlbacteria)]|nr:CoB--CoM heterodisulfide reductase subunit B [Candidatus Stahlbacteria bacterium]